MASSIVNFWRELKDTTAPVIHPRDKEAFVGALHSFNLDFPPPAYIGAVDDAVCIVLYANGGYDPDVTPMEFREIITPANFLEYLHQPRRIAPSRIAPYYATVNFSHLIESGKVALVNAVAYRSRKISEEPENEDLAVRLPSVAAHRAWLRDKILPEVRKGNRVLVIKRGRLWQMHKGDCDGKAIFWGQPHIKHLPLDVLERLNTI